MQIGIRCSILYTNVCNENELNLFRFIYRPDLYSHNLCLALVFFTGFYWIIQNAASHTPIVSKFVLNIKNDMNLQACWYFKSKTIAKEEEKVQYLRISTRHLAILSSIM